MLLLLDEAASSGRSGSNNGSGAHEGDGSRNFVTSFSIEDDAASDVSNANEIPREASVAPLPNQADSHDSLRNDRSLGQLVTVCEEEAPLQSPIESLDGGSRESTPRVSTSPSVTRHLSGPASHSCTGQNASSLAASAAISLAAKREDELLARLELQKKAIAELEAALLVMQDEAASADGLMSRQVKEWSQRIRGLENDLKAAKKVMEEREQEKLKHSEEIESLRATVANLSLKLAADASSPSQSASKQSGPTETRALLAEIEGLRSSNLDLQRDLSAALARQEATAAELKNTEARAAEKEALLEAEISKSVSELDARDKRYQAELAKRRSEIDSIKSESEKVRKEFGKISTAAELVKAEFDKVRQENGHLVASLAKTKSEQERIVAGLKAELAAAVAASEAAKGEAALSQRDHAGIALLQASLDASRAEASEALELIAAKDESLLALAAEVNDLKAGLQGAEAELEAQKALHLSTRAASAALQLELEQARSEAADAHAEFKLQVQQLQNSVVSAEQDAAGAREELGALAREKEHIVVSLQGDIDRLVLSLEQAEARCQAAEHEAQTRAAGETRACDEQVERLSARVAALTAALHSADCSVETLAREKEGLAATNASLLSQVEQRITEQRNLEIDVQRLTLEAAEVRAMLDAESSAIITGLKGTHAEELSIAKQEYEHSLESLKATLNAESIAIISGLKDTHAEELRLAKQEYEHGLESLKTTLRESAVIIASLKDAHAEELRLAKQEYEHALESLQAQLEQEQKLRTQETEKAAQSLDHITQSHREFLEQSESMASVLEAEVARARDELLRKEAECEAQRQRLQALSSTYDADVSKEREQIHAEWSNKFASEVQRLRQDHAASTSQLQASLERKVQQGEQKLAAMETELACARQETARFRDEAAALALVPAASYPGLPSSASNEDLYRIQSQSDIQQREIASLRSALAAMDQLGGGFQARELAEANKRVDQADADLSKARGTIQELEARVARQNEDYAHLLETTKSQLATVLETNEASRARLEAELGECRAQLAEVNEAFRSFKKKAAAKVRSMQQATAQGPPLVQGAAPPPQSNVPTEHEDADVENIAQQTAEAEVRRVLEAEREAEREAQREKERAIEAEREAQREKERAIEAEREAQREKERAIEAEREAQREKERAIEAEREAQRERERREERQVREREKKREKERLLREEQRQAEDRVREDQRAREREAETARDKQRQEERLREQRDREHDIARVAQLQTLLEVQKEREQERERRWEETRALEKDVLKARETELAVERRKLAEAERERSRLEQLVQAKVQAASDASHSLKAEMESEVTQRLAAQERCRSLVDTIAALAKRAALAAEGHASAADSIDASLDSSSGPELSAALGSLSASLRALGAGHSKVSLLSEELERVSKRAEAEREKSAKRERSSEARLASLQRSLDEASQACAKAQASEGAALSRLREAEHELHRALAKCAEVKDSAKRAEENYSSEISALSLRVSQVDQAYLLEKERAASANRELEQLRQSYELQIQAAHAEAAAETELALEDAEARIIELKKEVGRLQAALELAHRAAAASSASSVSSAGAAAASAGRTHLGTLRSGEQGAAWSDSDKGRSELRASRDSRASHPEDHAGRRPPEPGAQPPAFSQQAYSAASYAPGSTPERRKGLVHAPAVGTRASHAVSALEDMDSVLRQSLDAPSAGSLGSSFSTHRPAKVRSAGVELLASFPQLSRSTEAQLAVLAVLDLKGSVLDAEQLSKVAKVLDSSLTITTLNLTRTGVDDDGATVLAASLHRNAILTTLHLSGNSIGPVGCEALALALHRTNRSLIALNLEWNSIGVSGVRALAAMLQANPVLTSLNVAGNKCGPEGARFLAESLRGPPPSSPFSSSSFSGYSGTIGHGRGAPALRTLNLEWCDTEDAGASFLAGALSSSRCPLTALCLASNGIGDVGCLALARAISVSRKLCVLDLRMNAITSEGAAELSKALIVNTSLVSLNLEANAIDEAGIFGIAKVLKRKEACQVVVVEENHY